VLSKLSPHQVSVLTGKSFFPNIISAPFHHGLVIVFTAAAIMSFVGALVSLMRGKQFYYEEPGTAPPPASAAANGDGDGASRDGASQDGASWDEASRDEAARPAPGGRG
jgi:hypothetical protein